MENAKAESKKMWPLWATIAVILFWLTGFTFWIQYEKTQKEKDWDKKLVAEKSKADAPCEDPKPKAEINPKNAKANAKAKANEKAKPKPEAKMEPKTSLQIAELVPVLTNAPASKKAVDTTPEVEIKSILDGVDPDFGKTKVVFTPLPEKEVEQPRVGRKIIVIRQQLMMPHYGGGYSTGYYQRYAPQVTYGSQYVPPPQTVFVPAPAVIVPAPSVVTPAPSVVTPAGGYRPQGSTGGHSPSGTTGTAH